jgi:serine/threonine protein kinase
VRRHFTSVQAMSELDPSWPTTRPGAREASVADKVPVHDALGPGTRLGEFEIVRVLGTGGFGIVYLARDHVLLREVAIKEYMPAMLAGRGAGDTVSLRSERFAQTFEKGLESFLSEARLLASFDHRSLVKVHRFWRSNATAYMAMQYHPGQTLKEARLHMSASPDGAWLSAFMEAILGALERLHGEGVFHRDISPDNIMMLDDGRPVLLDFGCARRVVADGAQSFTAHLKPQFAPLEQYADEAGMRQGPWTDLYSLGATLYFVVTGRAPTPSVVRAARDILPTLSSLPHSAHPGLSPTLLATIDWMMALAPYARPQSVAAVRRALSGDIAPPLPSARHVSAPSTVSAPDPSSSDAAPETATPPLRWAKGIAARAAALRTSPVPARSRSSRSTRMSIASSLAMIGLVAFAWGAWTFDRTAPARPHETRAMAEAPKATARLAPPASASPAPVVSSSADQVVLRVAPGAAQEEALAPVARAIPLAAERVASRPEPAVTLAPSSRRVPAHDRARTGRTKAQSKVVPARAPTRTARSGCGASGLVARALCVLQPCKASRERSSSECVARLRADEARRQRI